ncbi:MAG: hypothetical protein LBH25_01370 [Fibromonadaceae bacterium]|jgi:hypothetical protein|nr:hypothetical protein [Fibromonadaceae bacterium]
MKAGKSMMFLIVLLAIGTISAQNVIGASQSVNVKGTLQLRSGMIAVVDGNASYFVPMLGRYIGFIDGLKEGAKISVEGYASRDYIQPSKVTINGKSYDFQPPVGDNILGYGCGGHGSNCGMMSYNGRGYNCGMMGYVGRGRNGNGN